VSPGVLLIRYETLRLVKHEAERLAGAQPQSKKKVRKAAAILPE
jgi:hypothetical protein